MEVRATLTPGQHGTKQLQKQFGDQLVCVRYRYDKETKRRVKTVELIVEDTPWLTTDEPDLRIPRPRQRVVRDVLLHINYQETDLRQQVKQAGGFWLKNKKLWRLGYEKVVQLGLEKRIVELVDTNDLGF